jgi:tyrosyl-tRNA synthetase
MQDRQLLAQATHLTGLSARMEQGPCSAYIGFDPTADSLHVGSLVPLLALRRWQVAGHRPIALVGGATGLIGDPSGKTAERQLNTGDVVDMWTQRLRAQIEPFLDFSGSTAAQMVNNHDWFGGMGALQFLRDVGKLVSVNTLMGRDAVRQRLEREGVGISYTEFSYGLLQAYDFAHLYQQHGCCLQMGGSDQWGNITLGLDMVRRLHGGEAFGLTLPLVTKSDGSKFGKSEDGNVWLSASKTSPYAFYQFWLNTADEDVERFLNFYTFMNPRDAFEVVQADREGSGKPQAQGMLADLVTSMVHGQDALRSAQRITQALFSRDLSGLSEPDFAQLAMDGLPTTTLTGEQQQEKGALADLLVGAGLADSKTQARSLLRQQAIAVNGLAVEEVQSLGVAHRLHGRYTLLQRGAKRHALVVWA